MESYIYDGLLASVNFNAPQIRNKSKLILQSLYKTKYQNKIEFTKINPSHPYALKTILTETEFVNQNIDNLLNCLKEHKTIMQIGNTSQNLFLDNQILINAYKILIGDNLKNTISKLIDYDNLKLYIQHSYAPQKYVIPSPTNLAVSEEDIKLLLSLYDIYKTDDQWGQ